MMAAADLLPKDKKRSLARLAVLEEESMGRRSLLSGKVWASYWRCLSLAGLPINLSCRIPQTLTANKSSPGHRNQAAATS